MAKQVKDSEKPVDAGSAPDVDPEVDAGSAPDVDPEVDAGAETKGEKPEAAVAEGHTKFVTTDRVKVNGGTMRDPTTGIVYTRGQPRLGDNQEGSWLHCQIEAGFIKSGVSPEPAVESEEG